MIDTPVRSGEKGPLGNARWWMSIAMKSFRLVPRYADNVIQVDPGHHEAVDGGSAGGPHPFCTFDTYSGSIAV